MNNKKIAFITCVNDDGMYEECLRYIRNLKIPNGYEIDVISIKEADSITSAYNNAMNSTDAKYKVYLHQDTLIINKNFIGDIIKIFSLDENIGMIGLTGAKTIPINAKWWESNKKYGKVYESHTGSMELLSFEEIYGECEEVKAIDGFIMITQYDIPWREDIFTGWHFYDISQSVEFDLVEYKVVIPKQECSWCIHECGINDMKDEYNKYRITFLNEYSKNIFPLVSILIPTYNRPEYFKIALESVINQTYKNIEIVIGDDSTNNDTEELIKTEYINKYDNIRYYHNAENLGQFNNDLKLMELANGEYINFLMDDDLFETIKIEKMMNYFINDNEDEISLVTSHRGVIDSKGQYKGIFAQTNDIFDEDIILNAEECVDFMLINNFNYIGEPTTVLFKKSKLNEDFGIFNGRKYGCNVDIATWLNLLSNGKMIFINEVLSYFRRFEGQQSCSDRMKILGATDYIHEVLISRTKGFLSDNINFYKASKNCLNYCYMINDEVCNKNELDLSKENEEFSKLLRILDNELSNTSEKFPLVSILIPTYNQTKYLKEALESALNQTYPNVEIIIGDDSTNGEVEEFIKYYTQKHKNIKYFRNEKNELDYGLTNCQRLLEASNGEFVNYLFHDDIFAKDKIEKMMNYFLNNPELTLVTSSRQLIDSNGDKLPMELAFQPIADNDIIISGYEMTRYMVNNFINYIGEPTVVLFKKRYLEYGFGNFNGVAFKCNVDIAMWAQVLQYGDGAYIAEPLSYFRKHEEQNSNKIGLHIKGIIDFYHYIEQSYKIGVIRDHAEYKKIIVKWLKIFTDEIILYDKLLVEHHDELKYLRKIYMNIVNLLFENKEKYKVCPICGEKVERFLPYQYKTNKTDFVYKYQIIGSDVEHFSCPACYSHD